MHQWITTIITALILITSLTCTTGKEGAEPCVPEGTFALVNCMLIDGNGGNPVQDAILIVQAGKILAVGSKSSVSIPPNTPLIDVNGATILPGFINAHIHSGFNRSNLEAWAQAGVTTVRDLCGPASFSLRDELLKDPKYARLVASGPMVSVPNGYPKVPWGVTNMLEVTSTDDARTKVSALIDSGADIVKLAVESGQSFGYVIPSLTQDEATAAVQVAHEYGTIASAHVLIAKDLGRALDVGVDDIAHMVTDSLYDTLITRMIHGGVFWVPTIELWQNVGYGNGPAAIKNLRKFVQAGGMVALGTDYDGYNTPFQLGMPIKEMKWMLQAGMTPMQVIIAGTKNAAQVCNRQNDLGTLEAGKIADVLVIDGNPLSDIENVLNVKMVIHNGVIIRKSE
jgi:imidazolonepropionase-like amidohydrolase